MSRLPGGELATRPLHFFWIVDCSGSMSIDGKIQSLNIAIRECLPNMRQVAAENPNASVMVRTLKFSHGASWHKTSDAIPLDAFNWVDLEADPLQKSHGTSQIDIIFLIDTSGSMFDEIETVKRDCQKFADHIINKGAKVRLGLIGFDIGGHNPSKSGLEGSSTNYTVYDLSRYTIGIWPLTSPSEFKHNVQSLSLGLFGGEGCYLANNDTIDIFPHIVRAFDGPATVNRTLVIISDEIGSDDGLSEIVNHLNKASVTTHVLGVPKRNRGRAHQELAKRTGGQFWDILSSKGAHDFSDLFEDVAETIAKEVTETLANGTVSSGTDIGTALSMLAQQLKIPPMTDHALPPVLVLISDGQPTDDFSRGLNALMDQPWGIKAARIAIAIGDDADLGPLQRFIGHTELKPLQANNPEALVHYIKWASTAVLKAASSPASQPEDTRKEKVNVPIPSVEEVDQISAKDEW